MQNSTKSYAALIGKIILGVLIFLALLPEVLRWTLVSVVSDYGAGTLQVDDIDLNLFKGTAGIEQVSLKEAETVKLELDEARVDVSWLKLLLGEFHIETLSVDGVRFSVTQQEDGSWLVVVPLPAAEEEQSAEDVQPVNLYALLKQEFPKVVLRQAALTNVEVQLNSAMAKGQLQLDELAINNLTSWQDSNAAIQLQAKWQQTPVDIDVQLNPWREQPEINAQLKVDKLALADFKPLPKGKLIGKFSTATAVTIKLLPEGMAIDFNSDGVLTDIEAAYNNIAASNEKLSLASAGELLLSSDAKTLQSLKVTADLSTDKLNVRETDQQLALLNWSSLTVNQFSINEAMNASFDTLQLRDLALIHGDKNQGGFTTQQLSVEQFAWQEQHRLLIDNIIVSGGQYHVVLNKQGQLELENIITGVLARFESEEKTGEEAGTNTEQAVVDSKTVDDVQKESPPLKVSIEKIRVSEDTTIKFVDLRFARPVEQHLAIEQLELDHIDQQNPDKKTLLTLKGSIGEFGKVDVSGNVQPFAKNIFGQFSGELDGIELPEISPYSEAYLGYQLSQGHYDHTFEVSIANEEVDVKNVLKLRQLKVKSVDAKEPQPLEKQLDVPLGLALDMLRDSDDNIELKVPVKGRLDQPDVDISQIINRALGKAVKSGATSYLKYALQPYGAVLLAADFVGDQVNAVHLDPMPFEAGSDTVPEKTEYIEKLHTLLQERPNLHLSLCGRSNASDRQALLAMQDITPATDVQDNSVVPPATEPQTANATVESQANTEPQIPKAELVQLANQRAKNLKRLFIEKGVKGNRLLLCKAEFKEDGAAGVALQM